MSQIYNFIVFLIKIIVCELIILAYTFITIPQEFSLLKG